MTRFFAVCLLLLAQSAFAQTTTPPATPAGATWTISVTGTIDANTTKVCVLVDQMTPVCKDYAPLAQPFNVSVPNVVAGQHIVFVMAQNPESASHAGPFIVQSGWSVPTPPKDVQTTPTLVVAQPTGTTSSSSTNP